MSRDAEEADECRPAPRVSGRPKELSQAPRRDDHRRRPVDAGRGLPLRPLPPARLLRGVPAPAGRGDGPLGRQLAVPRGDRRMPTRSSARSARSSVSTTSCRSAVPPHGFSHEDPVCELASLVIRPGDRSTGVIENLYRNGWLGAFRSDSTSVVALIDPWLYRVFKDVYAMPFTVIGESHHYMGSDPVPVGMALGQAHLRRPRPPQPGVLGLDPRARPEEIAAWVCRSCSRARARSTWSGRRECGHAPRRVDHASEAGRGRCVSARRPRCRRLETVDPGPGPASGCRPRRWCRGTRPAPRS